MEDENSKVAIIFCSIGYLTDSLLSDVMETKTQFKLFENQVVGLKEIVFNIFKKFVGIGEKRAVNALKFFFVLSFVFVRCILVIDVA